MDNASSDNSAAEARRFEDAVRVIEMGRNAGFGAACNVGYRETSAPYVLFLNSDIEAGPSSLEALCRFMDSHPEAGAAGGRLVDAGGSPQVGFNVRTFPTAAAACFEILMVDELFPRNPVTRRHRMLDFSHREVAEVDQPAGACLLVRRSVLDRVGPFDERFEPAWFEDVDLCLRLKQNGFPIYFVPEAEFAHRGGVSLESLTYGEFLSSYYRNLLRYFEKHHGRVVALWLRIMVGFGMLERSILGCILKPRPDVTRTDAWTAYWRVMRETL